MVASDRVLYESKLAELCGRDCEACAALNTLILLFDVPGQPGLHQRIWIDAGWSVYRGELEVLASTDLPEDDNDAVLLKEWYDSIQGLGISRLTGYAFEWDGSLRLECGEVFSVVAHYSQEDYDESETWYSHWYVSDPFKLHPRRVAK